jgi:hypothetical protein
MVDDVSDVDGGLFGAALKSTLAAVGAEARAPATLDPAFFHRTLARWLGLPEGRSRVADPVSWSYRYWRAELRRDDAHDDGERRAYAASLSLTHHDQPEEVSWWIHTNADGAIVDAGWRSAPPQLDVDDGADVVSAPVIDDEVARRLFDDAADDG